jgi:hypothetical protein
VFLLPRRERGPSGELLPILAFGRMTGPAWLAPTHGEAGEGAGGDSPQDAHTRVAPFVAPLPSGYGYRHYDRPSKTTGEE